MSENVKFVLNGCDIHLIAEAPKDMTLEQLLAQCDKIEPLWCACGICSIAAAEFPEHVETDVIIGYNSVHKAREYANCRIKYMVRRGVRGCM